MSFHHLDQFARTDSPLTRRDPAVRLVGTVIIALGAAILPLGAWAQMTALGALVAGLAALAGIPPRAFFVRLAPPLAFVFLVSAAVMVLAPGNTIGRIGPLAITDAGLLRFGSVVGRAAVALGAAVVLVSTTPFSQLLQGLRTLRLPVAVTTSLGLAYRFLYILNDEIERLRRAARSRNASEGATPRRRLLMGITSAVLQRSFVRSEHLHRAMLARGFTGQMPSLDSTPDPGHPIRDLGLLTAAVIAIAGSALL